MGLIMTPTPRSPQKALLIWLALLLGALGVPTALWASGEEIAQKITHMRAPPAPRRPGWTVRFRTIGYKPAVRFLGIFECRFRVRLAR